MRTISDYTIYCTPEQTKKALELGAPIKVLPHMFSLPKEAIEKFKYIDLCDRYLYIPTAAQMLEWLRQEKGFKFRINDYKDGTDWSVIKGLFSKHGYSTISSTEAILASIDAALECLSN